MPLKPDVLVVVLAIASVVNHEVTPISVFFAIVSIVLVTMFTLIYKNLQSLCTSRLAMYVPCSTYLETMISMEHKFSALFARLRKGRVLLRA
jgi:hypothetical protein